MKPTLPLRALLALLLTSMWTLPAQADTKLVNGTKLKDWIEYHEDLKTLHATFTQTRKLLTVRNPLQAEGEVWFKAPDLFRWKLGEPTKTLVVHNGEAVTILDVENKKAQIVTGSPDEESAGSYLNMAFPRSFDDFVAAFEFLQYEEMGDLLTVKVSPKDPKLGEDIRSITFVIETPTNQLKDFSVNMKGGSSIETVFHEILEDVELDDSLFEESLDGYEIEQP